MSEEPGNLNPLWQLFLMRVRAFWREPAVLFWVFAFPLLTSLALGIAFRNRELARIHVAVADGPDADAISQMLDHTEGLAAERATVEIGKEWLRLGRVALVLVPGATPEVLIDPTQPDGRTAKWITLDALERMKGRKDLLTVSERKVTAPGSRYIDFLIPGLLGMGLMSSGVWGIGWALVQMRSGKLLKCMVATPMKRSHLLLSFILSRCVLAVVETLFLIVMARVLFDVRVFGNVATLVMFGLAGAVSFGGLSLLVASRVSKSETASGIMNAVTMPMMGLSGVFFSSSHFPGWMQPAIKALPLTALNDGLRAVMIDGVGVVGLAIPFAVLAAWGGISFVAAVRLFRWS